MLRGMLGLHIIMTAAKAGKLIVQAQLAHHKLQASQMLMVYLLVGRKGVP